MPPKATKRTRTSSFPFQPSREKSSPNRTFPPDEPDEKDELELDCPLRSSMLELFVNHQFSYKSP